MRTGAFAAFVVLTIMFAPAAKAHSEVIGTFPANGDTVSSDVSQIKLRFSQAVRVTLLRVAAQDDGLVAPLSDLPAAFVDALQVDVPTLEPGDYDARWTAVAKDGHVMSGGFSFTVAD